MNELRIEHPSVGATYHHETYGVYSYSTYPESSVLAGQERRLFLADFRTLEEAQTVYPEAAWEGAGSGYREVSVPHTAPDWFDPASAGETWDDADY